MKTLNALTAGFRSTNKSFRMIALLYVVNFLIAAIVAWGFQSVLASTIGASMSLERLVKDFDYTVFSDFMFKDGAGIDALLSQLAWLLVFYFLVNTLLGGGTIAGLLEIDEPFSMRMFFENCGYYFFRFVRLLLIFAVIGGLVGVIFAGILGMIYGAVTAGAVSEVWPFSLGIIFFFLFLFVVMLVVMMADYAKVATVTEDARSMLKTAWTSIKFVFRHFLSTTVLQLGIVAILVLSVILYLLLEGKIGMATPFTILLMFLVQQASVGFKVYTRVLTFGGELALFGEFAPEEAATEPSTVPEAPPLQPPAAVELPVTRTVAKGSAKRKATPSRATAAKPRVQKKRTVRKSR